MAEAKSKKPTTSKKTEDENLKSETKSKTKSKKIETSKQKITKKTVSSETDKKIIEQNPVPNTVLQITTEPKAQLAKAGKKSAKAIKEVEAKIAKEERKTEIKAKESTEKPKQNQKVTNILDRRSKGYKKSYEMIELDKVYSIKDALDLATKTSHVKFDASIELHIRLGVDPRQADQNLRDSVIFPSGTGKDTKVAVFTDVEGVAKAKKAGADVAGSDEFLQLLDKGQIDFDILITTPQQMAKLGKYARILGPKGLMPNPKSGTVTTDIEKAVTEAKAGKVEYRVDSTGIVHVAIGKVSFGVDKLLLNANAILASVKSNKPSSLKNIYVKSIFVTTSMGPSINVSISEI